MGRPFLRCVAIAAGALISAFAVQGAMAQTPAVASSPSGEALFRSRCASCHDGQPNSRAPSPEALRQRTPAAIISALAGGAMRAQGASLSGLERRALAEYLSGAKVEGDPTGAAKGRCTVAATFKLTPGASWNGWGAGVTNRRFQTATDAGISAEQAPRLTLKWAFGFPDASLSWAQPSVVGGWLFVGSQNGTVYGLDAKSGCIHWVFSADGGVRTAISVGPRTGGVAVYFGDTNAQAYALDANTGKLLWKTRVEAHPLARITGAPTLYRDRLYVPTSSYEESQGASPDYGCCSFRGSVSAIDIKTGKVAWRTYMIAETPKPRGKSSTGVTLYSPSGASIWSAPTVDAKRGLVYVGTGNNYSGVDGPTSDSVVALKLATGAIVWSKQLFPKDTFVSGCRKGAASPNCADQSGPDFDFGNSPILAKLPNGRDAIVIGQKSGMGWALNPDKAGEIVWQYRAGVGGALGGIEWGSAVDATHAYFAVSDISSPNPGGLHAVDLTTGQRVWYAAPPTPTCPAGTRCNGAQAAAVTVIPGVVFEGSNDGTIRAYSTRDGSVLWSFDSNRPFETLNGMPGQGASMLGPGAVVAGGMLYVPSGYGGFGGRPGNVLLAFEVGG